MKKVYFIIMTLFVMCVLPVYAQINRQHVYSCPYFVMNGKNITGVKEVRLFNFSDGTELFRIFYQDNTFESIRMWNGRITKNITGADEYQYDAAMSESIQTVPSFRIGIIEGTYLTVVFFYEIGNNRLFGEMRIRKE